MARALSEQYVVTVRFPKPIPWVLAALLAILLAMALYVVWGNEGLPDDADSSAIFWTLIGASALMTIALVLSVRSYNAVIWAGGADYIDLNPSRRSHQRIAHGSLLLVEMSGHETVLIHDGRRMRGLDLGHPPDEAAAYWTEVASRLANHGYRQARPTDDDGAECGCCGCLSLFPTKAVRHWDTLWKVAKCPACNGPHVMTVSEEGAAMTRRGLWMSGVAAGLSPPGP